MDKERRKMKSVRKYSRRYPVDCRGTLWRFLGPDSLLISFERSCLRFVVKFKLKSLGNFKVENEEEKEV